MPQSQQALFSIIRNRLTQNAGMTAQVASNAITVSLQQDPVTYPAIRIKITGAGENRLLPLVFTLRAINQLHT
jgi:hypothetical protein